ncbi:MAG: hypothetical protein LR008_00845 [Candidatus Pacebacteria bacterium]|nr:hypothetical protein [Candidatus Paceibacterota bacterium]
MSLTLKKLAVFTMLIPVFFLSTGAADVLAGFGITPPYVRNSSLTRNSVYEQQILLVRGDANVAQKAEVSIDAPEIEGWLYLVEGQEIIMEKGVQKVPMTVRVTVPDDADFGDYRGKIRIRTLPADGEVAAGAVSISLGALVDVYLSVIDREIRDFRVRRISAADLNEGSKVGWLFFPGKINFSMLIENTGNVDISPSKVEFSIFDRTGKILLEETKNIGKIEKVLPYGTETVTAEIPTRLPAGSYIARYTVYNDEDIKQEGDITFNIVAEGTLQTAGFGFSGLSISHKISVLLPVFAVMIAALYIWSAKRKYKVIRQ